jgi:hypothetical protein
MKYRLCSRNTIELDRIGCSIVKLANKIYPFEQATQYFDSQADIVNVLAHNCKSDDKP